VPPDRAVATSEFVVISKAIVCRVVAGLPTLAGLSMAAAALSTAIADPAE